MNVTFDYQADEDIKSFDKHLQGFFRNHIDKLCRMPPRRHMKRGLPFFVENVTNQARLVYLEEGELIKVIRCFATHKEYERWYNSFR